MRNDEPLRHDLPQTPLKRHAHGPNRHSTATHQPHVALLCSLRLGLPYLQLARRLWGQLIDPRETFLPLPHNAYLKAWALGRPIIRHITGRLYDAILIDEAQVGGWGARGYEYRAWGRARAVE